jgi:hypothetical protein
VFTDLEGSEIRSGAWKFNNQGFGIRDFHLEGEKVADCDDVPVGFNVDGWYFETR